MAPPARTVDDSISPRQARYLKRARREEPSHEPTLPTPTTSWEEEEEDPQELVYEEEFEELPPSPQQQEEQASPPPQGGEEIESDSDSAPKFYPMKTVRSKGTEGGKAAKDLREFLSVGQGHIVPEYLVKSVERPGRTEYIAHVSIFHGDMLASVHHSNAWRTTQESAVADAAWEAKTSVTHQFRQELKDTSYELLPYRKSGTDKFDITPVGGSPYQPAVVRLQETTLDLCRRYSALQAELGYYRAKVLDLEKTCRAYMRYQEGEDNELRHSDCETGSVTSAGHPDHPDDEGQSPDAGDGNTGA